MFAYSMQLVSNCYNFGLNFVKQKKNADVIQRLLYPSGNDCLLRD